VALVAVSVLADVVSKNQPAVLVVVFLWWQCHMSSSIDDLATLLLVAFVSREKNYWWHWWQCFCGGVILTLCIQQVPESCKCSSITFDTASGQIKTIMAFGGISVVVVLQHHIKSKTGTINLHCWWWCCCGAW